MDQLTRPAISCRTSRLGRAAAPRTARAVMLALSSGLLCLTGCAGAGSLCREVCHEPVITGRAIQLTAGRHHPGQRLARRADYSWTCRTGEFGFSRTYWQRFPDMCPPEMEYRSEELPVVPEGEPVAPAELPESDAELPESDAELELELPDEPDEDFEAPSEFRSRATPPVDLFPSPSDQGTKRTSAPVYAATSDERMEDAVRSTERKVTISLPIDQGAMEPQSKPAVAGGVKVVVAPTPRTLPTVASVSDEGDEPGPVTGARPRTVSFSTERRATTVRESVADVDEAPEQTPNSKRAGGVVRRVTLSGVERASHRVVDEEAPRLKAKPAPVRPTVPDTPVSHRSRFRQPSAQSTGGGILAGWLW